MLLGKLCRFFLKNLAILRWLEGLCREGFSKLTIPAHLHRGPDDDWLTQTVKIHQDNNVIVRANHVAWSIWAWYDSSHCHGNGVTDVL